MSTAEAQAKLAQLRAQYRGQQGGVQWYWSPVLGQWIAARSDGAGGIDLQQVAGTSCNCGG